MNVVVGSVIVLYSQPFKFLSLFGGQLVHDLARVLTLIERVNLWCERQLMDNHLAVLKFFDRFSERTPIEIDFSLVEKLSAFGTSVLSRPMLDVLHMC
jgi:hypothetical protein